MTKLLSLLFLIPTLAFGASIPFSGLQPDQFGSNVGTGKIWLKTGFVTTNGVSTASTNYGSVGRTNWTWMDASGWHNTNNSAVNQSVDISKGNVIVGGFIGVGTNKNPLSALTIDNTKAAAGLKIYNTADQVTDTAFAYGRVATNRAYWGSSKTGAGSGMDLFFITGGTMFSFGRSEGNEVFELNTAASRASDSAPIIKFRPTGNLTGVGFTIGFELAASYVPASGANNEHIGIMISPALNSTAAATTSQYFAMRLSPHYAGTTGFTNLNVFDFGTNSSFEGLGAHTSFFYMTTNGVPVGNKGFSSFATDARVSIGATGWTNTFGKNAHVAFDGTAITFVLKTAAGTPWHTNAAALASGFVTLQPGGAIVISGTGVTGDAVPF